MKHNNIYAVVGLGFGDEGKGLVTEFLAAKANNPVVTRYSGGQQAGHTVYKDDVSHVFSNFGSGTLSNIPTYWTKYCTFDPIGFTNELSDLLKLGLKPKIFIDKRTPVTTPFDVYKNQNNDSIEHGTCGVGVGATFQREEDFYNLTVSDLFYPKILKAKLDLIKDYYCKSDPFLIPKVDKFLERVEVVKGYRNLELVNKLAHDGDIIFEGSQGLLLDQHYGFFPNVTRSNTGSKNIIEMLSNTHINYYLVTRAYQTRHGNGFMTNEELPLKLNENPDETNVNNLYQGEFRKTVLDLDLLVYAIEKDIDISESFNKTLVITCLDQMKEYSFTSNGIVNTFKTEKGFINEIKSILNIENVLISKSPYSSQITKFND